MPGLGERRPAVVPRPGYIDAFSVISVALAAISLSRIRQCRAGLATSMLIGAECYRAGKPGLYGIGRTWWE